MFGNKQRLTGAGYTSRVGQWTQRSLIKSVQRGTITIANAASTNTAAITSVDPNNSVLVFLGQDASNTGTAGSNGTAGLTFTNATTITATRAGTVSQLIVGFEVREYWPGVIKSIQRGTTNVTVGAGTTQAITSVNTAKAILSCLGIELDANPYQNDVEQTRGALTNATTLTFTSAFATPTLIYHWQVEEWY